MQLFDMATPTLTVNGVAKAFNQFFCLSRSSNYFNLKLTPSNSFQPFNRAATSSWATSILGPVVDLLRTGVLLLPLVFQEKALELLVDPFLACSSRLVDLMLAVVAVDGDLVVAEAIIHDVTMEVEAWIRAAVVVDLVDVVVEEEIDMVMVPIEMTWIKFHFQSKISEI